ncbi:MAG TPA: PHP domain-containing protein, partial [Firmicutes bacterium]|nr:PHP domain-containing protein [Bacillota bacterium]
MRDLTRKYADLHIHSTYSDSSLTPKDVLKYAQMVGLSCISITDHDSVGGVPEAYEYAKQLEIEFIPGIELSAIYNGIDIHILGYFIDWTDKEFLGILGNIQDYRRKRIRLILGKLRNFGIKIDYDFVLNLSGNHSLGRPHVALAMKELGYVEKPQEAFDKYLADDKPAFVPKFQMSPRDCVELINSVRGIPILAHPVFIYQKINIFELIGFGIRGMEVIHIQHSKNDEVLFSRICNSHKLLKTGGSDFHGILNEEMLLGQKKVPYEYVLSLKEEAGA